MPKTNEDIYRLIQSTNDKIKRQIKDLRNKITEEIDNLTIKNKGLAEENKVLKNKIVYLERQQKKYNTVVYVIEEKTRQESDEIIKILNKKLN